MRLYLVLSFDSLDYIAKQSVLSTTKSGTSRLASSNNSGEIIEAIFASNLPAVIIEKLTRVAGQRKAERARPNCE